MKTQFLFWACFMLISIQFVQSQSRFANSRSTIGIKYNPYLTKESIPTDDYSIQTRLVAQAFYGLGGEFLVNDHIGLNAHFLYRFEDRTTVQGDNGPISLPVGYRTYHTTLNSAELAATLRFYQQDPRSAVRVYAEAGLGNAINLKSTSSRPLHPVPEIASELSKSYMNYEYVAVLIGGGTRYRFSNRWGLEAQFLGRLPIQSKFGRNIQYGLNFGLIRFSK